MAAVCAAADCNEPLPPGKKKFHTDGCGDRERQRRSRAKKRAIKFEGLAEENRRRAAATKAANQERKSKAESKDGRASARRGTGYDEFLSGRWPARIESGELTVGEVAEVIGTTHANVSRWMAAYGEDEKIAAARRGWRRAPETEALLEPTPTAFAEFRRQTFTDEWGQPYQTPPFQLVWIAAVLKAIAKGGRLVILSPPRHGKTQLLIHFCVWLILVRPNIRIMWIGGNEGIASQATGAVMDILENTPDLADKFLGPGGTWKPTSRSGKQWSASVFTVATREGAGIKSPTMVAVGKGGKLLSRDADLVVADDIVDADSVKTPKQRDDDKTWFNTQVSSRKEAHTALMDIGSRQHHEDLHGSLIVNPAFTAIVEHAHDPACEIPSHKPAPVNDDHPADCAECALHQDCLLWPGKRTFAFLQDQRIAMEDDRTYEMVYLNATRPDGDEYITEAHLQNCRNYGRGLGLGGLPKDARLRLIAGLDPAGTGRQAAFLWAYDLTTNKRYVVDIDVEKAGGTAHALHVIKLWDEKYHLKSWVVEQQAWREAIIQDTEVVTYAREHGIHIEPHFTHSYNKWDKDFGVTKQFTYFRSDPPLIDLPYGDEEAREQVRLYERELLRFQGAKTKTPCDVVMAAWFPESQIRRWRIEESTVMEVQYEQTDYDMPLLGDSYVTSAA